MHRAGASIALFSLVFVIFVYYNTNEGFVDVSRYRKVIGQPPYLQVTRENRTLPTPLLIMTYMRSGSTFLGDVIQANPDVFYVFEPLWSMEVYRTPLKDLLGNNIDGSYDEIARQITKYVFTCQMQKLPTTLLYHKNFMDVGRYTAEMNQCRANQTDMLSCAEHLQRKCLSSKFVMIKSIRIRAYQILDIKEDFPNLKLVYLVRDPRAVLRSQINYGVATGLHLNESEFTSQFCSNVTRDTQVVRLFQNFYPEDVNVVYHDSFEDNPIAMSRDLYRALGITFSPVAKKRIEALSGDGYNCTRNYALCTRKYDTTVEVAKWRTEISPSFSHIVDTLCISVYKSHGFLPLSNQEMLKNLSFPSHDIKLSIFRNIYLT